MRFLVHADEHSVQIGLTLAHAFKASVVVLQSGTISGQAAQAVTLFHTAGIETDIITRQSDWLQSLRVVTRAQPFDLVVTGSLWQRTGLLGGGMPKPLISDIPTNLLVARPGGVSLRRVLLAVSAAPQTTLLLGWAAQLAARLGTQTTLLHIVERPPSMFAGLPDMEETLSRFLQSNTSEARAVQGSVDRLLALGVQPELRLERGVAAEQIVAEAREGGYDLLIIGSSYGAPASTRLLMEGITAKLVQRSPCGVLIVRAEPTSTKI